MGFDPDAAARAATERSRRRRAARLRAVRRRRITLAAAFVLLAAAGAVYAHGMSGGRSALTHRHPRPPSGRTTTATVSTTTVATTTRSTTPTGTVSIAAVGDTMLGNTPTLPPDPDTYLDAVDADLRDGAQIVFGNLEGTLTDATAGKCGGPNSATCFAYRDPPAYAGVLRRAGFTILNDANNHSYDFGAAGQEQTVAALHAAGIAQTGLPGEITTVQVGAIRVAFVAFAPYSDTADLLELAAARTLIEQAKARADVVVVYMHAGAEGATADHVTGREETYDGEDRGNPEAFAHMAVDAGAALVIASGPHVLRGMQFYRHRLIAYSLGNFAGYTNFGLGGVLSTSCILRVTLSGAGRFISARVIPVELVGEGQPVPGGDAIVLLSQLSREDFGAAAARFSAAGEVRPP